MKSVVIYHRADFDGIFCREIARKFLPWAELIGWDYGDPEPVVAPDVDLYILDLSVPSLMGHPRLTWIDHHKSAIEKYDKIALKEGEEVLGNACFDFYFTVPAGYRVDGVAACRLAWQWFTNEQMRQGRAPWKQDYVDRKVSEPLAVRLAGEYDIWDKRDPDAETFQFGLRSEPAESLNWELLLGTTTETDAYVNALLAKGELLQRYQREQDAINVKRGFEVEFEGKKFLALNTARCNSLTFEAAAKPEHDGLMGFYWDGKQFVVSLYHSPHHKEHDLSQIAVKFGGGGHRGACGFRTGTLPFLART